MTAPLRILHLEDSPADAELVWKRLKREGIHCEIHRVQSRREFADALNNGGVDLVLADYKLPSFDGVAALEILRAKSADTPFVFVSGTIGEVTAIETLKAGATDYVLKDQLERLAPCVRRALREAEERKARKQYEKTIREQAELLDKAHDAILVSDLQDRITFWNDGAQRLYGWTKDEALGRDATELLGTDAESLEESRRVVREKGEWSGELQQKKKDEVPVTVASHWSLIRDEKRQPAACLIINTDITDRKKLETQFLRAQRMEGIGTLASGVAHDLNNVLAPILMSCQMLKLGISPDETQCLLETVEKSARRGADIVKQLITFARGSEGERVLLDPKHLIRDIVKILQGTFPKAIQIQTRVQTELWAVSADPTQLHQVLLNLCVNGRDAMPHGGKLTLAAENTELSEHHARMIPEASAGKYLLFKVADTGVGIPEQILGKIFDPFFTTKAPGKGTGLGLAVVLGIVKSHKGFVNVSSKLGSGTTFEVFIPAASPAEKSIPIPAGSADVEKGRGELVLVVDDEPEIRSVARQILTRHGYKVITADDGAHATVLFAQYIDEVQLVLTDLCMPYLDGVALIHALRKMKPGLPVIASSGMEERANAPELQQAEVSKFLKKPYAANELLEIVRETLAAVS